MFEGEDRDLVSLVLVCTECTIQQAYRHTVHMRHLTILDQESFPVIWSQCAFFVSITYKTDKYSIKCLYRRDDNAKYFSNF